MAGSSDEPPDASRQKRELLFSDKDKDNHRASTRLKQLHSHVTNSLESKSDESPSLTNPEGSEAEPSRLSSRRKAPSSQGSQTSALPSDYSDILSQLSQIRTLAVTPDLKSRGYINQKTSGKLWVRERIATLLDKDSFREIGSVAGSITWTSSSSNNGAPTSTDDKPASFTPTNNINGFGRLGGRPMLLTADDFSVRAGHADGAIMEKTAWLERVAVTMKLPIVKLVDGSSGGGSVTTIKRDERSYIPSAPFFRDAAKGLNDGVPNLGAVLGPAVSSKLGMAVAQTDSAGVRLDLAPPESYFAISA